MSSFFFSSKKSIRDRLADRFGFLNLHRLWHFFHELVKDGGLRVSSALTVNGKNLVYARTVIQPDGDITTFLDEGHFEEQRLIGRHFEMVRRSIRLFKDLTHWGKLIGSSPLMVWFIQEGDLVLSLITSDLVRPWQEWAPTLIWGGIATVIPYLAPAFFGLLFRWGYTAWRFFKGKR